jgi:hypothetical protein
MKTILTLVAFVFTVNEAFAKGLPLPKPEPVRTGEYCGLTQGFDDSLEDLDTSVTVEAGAKFTKLQARQIIEAARIMAAPWDQEKPEPNLKASIDYLVEASEGGEVYLKEAVAENVKYTYLIFYPGGNPYGVIFKKGTLSDVAHIQDSDIVCTAGGLK